MAKNKNKGKAKTLAQKNAEALKLAKEQAKAAETAAAEKKEEVKSPEKPAETSKKASEKATVEPTPYQKCLELMKFPPARQISARTFKDKHNVEQVEFKFVIESDKLPKKEQGERILTFPSSNVKEGDGIDLKRIREGIANPIPATMPEEQKKDPEKPSAKTSGTKEPSKKEETKREPAKKEPAKPKAEKPKKPAKEEVIFPEVVEIEEEKKPQTKLTKAGISNALSQLAQRDGTIDSNHQVELMGLLKNTYLSNDPEYTTTPELKSAMREIFDGTMCTLTLKLAAQLEEDGRAILGGIELPKEVFPHAKKAFAEFYGVDVTALPLKEDDKNIQMKLNFEDAPQETKDAARADAKASKKEIPEPNKDLPEDEKLDAIRNILNRSNADCQQTAKCRPALNLHDALEWAKKAFEISSDKEALAMLYNKFTDTKTLTLNMFARKTFGATKVNRSPLIAHALLAKDFEGIYTEKELAGLIPVLLAASAKYDATKEQTEDQNISVINNIITGINSKIIEQIGKKVDVIPFSPEGLKDKQKGLPGAKTYSTFASLYGLNVDKPKEIVKKIKEVMALYKTPVNKLSNYVEKSDYAK